MILTLVDATIPGGWQKSTIDEDTILYLNSALSKEKNFCYHEIKSVSTQVVAGMNFRFYLSGCLNQNNYENENEDLIDESCSCDNEQAEYEVDIFVQVWIQSYLLVDIRNKKNGASILEERVNRWLLSKHLNLFGDADNTMYTGGTPLYNERTGEKTNRMEFLNIKFPYSPWKGTPLHDGISLLQESSSQTSSLLPVLVCGVVALVIALVVIQTRRKQQGGYAPLFRNEQHSVQQ